MSSVKIHTSLNEKHAQFFCYKIYLDRTIHIDFIVALLTIIYMKTVPNDRSKMYFVGWQSLICHQAQSHLEKLNRASSSLQQGFTTWTLTGLWVLMNWNFGSLKWKGSKGERNCLKNLGFMLGNMYKKKTFQQFEALFLGRRLHGIYFLYCIECWCSVWNWSNMRCNTFIQHPLSLFLWSIIRLLNLRNNGICVVFYRDSIGPSRRTDNPKTMNYTDLFQAIQGIFKGMENRQRTKSDRFIIQ